EDPLLHSVVEGGVLAVGIPVELQGDVGGALAGAFSAPAGGQGEHRGAGGEGGRGPFRGAVGSADGHGVPLRIGVRWTAPSGRRGGCRRTRRSSAAAVSRGCGGRRARGSGALRRPG